MKAEEFEGVLEYLTREIANVERLFSVSGAPYVEKLNEIWHELNQHRLEMEQADRQPTPPASRVLGCGSQIGTI